MPSNRADFGLDRRAQGPHGLLQHLNPQARLGILDILKAGSRIWSAAALTCCSAASVTGRPPGTNPWARSWARPTAASADRTTLRSDRPDRQASAMRGRGRSKVPIGRPSR